MPPTPGFFATILDSKAQHWGDSGTKLAFDTVGGLMPLWGQGLLLLLFARSNRWLELFGNGELALYSAAFFASALYLVVKDYRQTQFVRRALFSLIGFAALCVSAIIFAGPTAVRILEVPIHVDKRT